jgi:hypothetical protein
VAIGLLNTKKMTRPISNARELAVKCYTMKTRMAKANAAYASSTYRKRVDPKIK